jgi:trigger factor
MKRILVALLALVLALSCFVACSNDEPKVTTPNPDSEGKDPEQLPAPDYDFMGNDLTGFVTLGQYKGLTVEVEPKLVITDEYFEREIKTQLIGYGHNNEIKEGTVGEDDVVRIKYVGYLGDEKFEGGTGNSQYFTIYDGGGYIEGFAEGLVGATIGQEFDLNVTFPEDYHNEDLKGKAVVFKTTVECVYEVKELTDAVVDNLSNGEIKTVDDFYTQARELMEKQAESEYKTAKLNAIWDKIFELSKEVKLPEDVVEEYYQYTLQYYKNYATNSWMTLEAFLEYIGLTLDDIREESKTQVFSDMIVYSLIKAENISITDEFYKQRLKEIAEESGVEEKEILEYYGEEEFKEMLLYTKGYEAVLEWNTCVDKTTENN